MTVMIDLLRRHGLLIAVLVPVCAVYFFWGVSDCIGDVPGDGPGYLMLAEHFSVFVRKDPVWDLLGAISRYPPGYPAYLALFGSSADLWRAHAVTVLGLPLALIACYVWLIEIDFSRSEAVLLIILIAVLPQTWRQGLRIQSEYLYLSLSLLSLILLNRYRRNPRMPVLYLAALAIAAAILTREVGLSLLPPLLVSLRGVPRRNAILVLGVAILPSVDWHFAHQAPLTYTKVLENAYHGNPFQQFAGQLGEELPALRRGFSNSLLYLGEPFLLTDVLGLLCLAAMSWRLVSLKPDALYATTNLLVLVAWPFPEEASRFLWVLLPILLVQPPLLLAQWLRRDPAALAPRAMLGFISAAVLLMALPGLSFAVSRYRAAADVPLAHAQSYLTWYQPDPTAAVVDTGVQAAIVDTLSRAPSVVGTGECIMSPRTDITAYFSRRLSYYYLTEEATDADFDSQIRTLGCRYGLIYLVTDRKYGTPMYPAKRLAGRGEVVLRSWLPYAQQEGRKPVCELLRFQWPERKSNGG